MSQIPAQWQKDRVSSPGGRFADEYHWRDGIGPRDQRPDGKVLSAARFGLGEYQRSFEGGVLIPSLASRQT